jgi:hypothetical protein
LFLNTDQANLIVIGAAWAGELITEFVLALTNDLKASDLSAAIHVYPAYAAAIQQMTASITTDHWLSGLSGKVIKGLARVGR